VESVDAVVGSEAVGLVVEGEFGVGETVGDTANGGTEVGGVVAARLSVARRGNAEWDSAGHGAREGDKQVFTLSVEAEDNVLAGNEELLDDGSQGDNLDFGRELNHSCGDGRLTRLYLLLISQGTG